MKHHGMWPSLVSRLGIVSVLLVLSIGHSVQASYAGSISILGVPESLVSASVGTGKALTPISSGNDGAYATAIQADGKILVAGYTHNGLNKDAALVRYNPDGSLDTSFGDGGYVITQASYDEWFEDLAIQPDGKIVAVGTCEESPVGAQFLLVRYHADGRQDSAFRGGQTLLWFGGPYRDFGKRVAVRDDGKIIVAGEAKYLSDSEVAIARLNSNGSPDTTFDGDGQIIIDTPSAFVEGLSLLPDSDQIVVTGYAWYPAGAHQLRFFLLRCDGDGSLDTAFGNGGMAISEFTGSAWGSVLLPDGKIMLAGTSLARFSADGSLDTTFGIGGQVIVDSRVDARAIVLQPDHKIVVGGSGRPGSSRDLAAVRYNADGSLDATFGDGGYMSADLASGEDYGEAVAIQADGKIVVAGFAFNGFDYDFAVARFDTDGNPDTTFGVPVAAGQPDWNTELVDQVGNVGTYANMALSTDGQPHIVYQDYTARRLKYAYYDGVVWHAELVGPATYPDQGAAISLDTSDTPHAVWYDLGTQKAMYGYRDDLGWHIQSINPPARPRWYSIAMDSAGRPHISYWGDSASGGGDTLWYSWNEGAGWTCEPVYVRTGLLYQPPAHMALDSTDTAHVAYSIPDLHQLQYAWRDSTWHVETVRPAIHGQVAIAADSGGRPHIILQRYTGGALTYFWRDGAGWHEEDVGDAGFSLVSIALDSMDRPHISYAANDGANYYVKHAYRDIAGWVTEIVAPGHGSWLALDANDAVHIAYRDPVNGDLRYATQRAPNAEPVLTVDQASVSVDEGQEASNGGSLSDPDQDWITLAASVGQITNNGDGTWSWSFTPADGPDDSQTVTIIADDGRGSIAQSTFQLVVDNVRPSPMPPLDQAADEASATSFSLGSFSDPGIDGPWQVVVDWGDGSDLDTFAVPIAGSLGNLSHTYADDGVYLASVILTEENGVGSSGGVEFDVIVDNVAPVAVDDTAGVGEDGPLVTIGVLTNDRDQAGSADPLTVTAVDSTGTVGIVTLVGNDVVYDPNGQFEYLAAGESAIDAFVYHISDGDGGVDSAVVTVVIDGQNDTPTIEVYDSTVAVDEGQVATNTGKFGDTDVSDIVVLRASVGMVVDHGDGTWSWSCVATDGPRDSQTVTIIADDGSGGTAQVSFDLVVSNVPPTIEAITVPFDPVNISDQPVSVSASFSDPGSVEDAPYTCSIDYGDESGTVAGTVTDLTCTGSTHTYAEPGVYVVIVTMTDKDGGADSAEATAFIIIYDPEGGFVTGGGWIDSPEGAYAPDPSLTGKANFGFVSKYKKGANVPTGQTEFQFKVANLNFHSESYQWLVIAGPKAQFKGTGTINGEGNYGFMLTAVDAGLTPSTDVDMFRIKIWDKDSGDVIVYDNQIGDADDGDPATAIGSGSIVIHKK